MVYEISIINMEHQTPRRCLIGDGTVVSSWSCQPCTIRNQSISSWAFKHSQRKDPLNSIYGIRIKYFAISPFFHTSFEHCIVTNPVLLLKQARCARERLKSNICMASISQIHESGWGRSDRSEDRWTQYISMIEKHKPRDLWETASI